MVSEPVQLALVGLLTAIAGGVFKLLVMMFAVRRSVDGQHDVLVGQVRDLRLEVLLLRQGERRVSDETVSGK